MAPIAFDIGIASQSGSPRSGRKRVGLDRTDHKSACLACTEENSVTQSVLVGGPDT